ncbi:EAL domain-containing protein [Pleionea sp. CnH1-48]|uniref:EAL domain-containing response regulator n=1 Tax=Pleionea sp. CnH1-48 TaxID=2954494 RepID=UPI002097011C|nr:EAL domain-containing protein [Pleionea sp. CnH1-48]MCO7223738.1 EAL domain-containing protein [Pleionea sp. CnH1-48]
MKPSILLVDDEIGITNSLKRVLRKDGYSLQAAHNGLEALKIMEQKPFDLVISDQRMPLMTGSALLSEVNRRYPTTSRILFSGYCDFAALSEAVNEASIQRFLLKPWVDGEIRQEVKTVLEQNAIDRHARENMHLTQKMERELTCAMANNQLFNYFQPIINTKNNEVYAAEMLIRWHHPERGLLTAADFFPLTQHSQVIRDIGIQQLDYLLDYLSHVLSQRKVCMNVSPLQLDSSIFYKKLESFCKKLGASASNFVLEITETELIRSLTQVSKQLYTLKSFGIKIALDDFCTGYSTMEYLRKLPVDIVKIDKSFIQNIDSDNRSLFIVASMIELANHLNFEVIAEGVENHSQVAKLNQLGCYLHQGYLYGRPKQYGKEDVGDCNNASVSKE